MKGIIRLRADHELARLRDAVRLAINDLDLEHRPTWASEAAESAGKEPVGCAMCWPRDGHWPCISRQVCDDLRHALDSR
jgi:hypothetical protein